MGLTPSITADLAILGILLLIAGHTYWLHVRRRLLFLDPLFAFWGGAVMIYIVQPITHGSTFIAWHGEALLAQTFAWILLGLAAVVAGYELRAGARLGSLIPAFPAQLSPNRLSSFGLACIVGGAIGYHHVFSVSGGFAKWTSIARGGTDYERVVGYFAELIRFLPVGVVLLLFAVEMYRSGPLQRGLAWSMAIGLWLWYLYLGTRRHTITFALLMMAAYYLPRRRNPSVILLSLLCVLLFVLTNFQAHYRGYFMNLSFNTKYMDMQEVALKVLPFLNDPQSGDLETEVSPGLDFNCVMSVIRHVPGTVPYNYGFGHLEPFTRWIPRRYWPDKRYPHMESVQAVLQESDLSQTYVRDTDLLMGPAFTFVGHWYYVGGAVGLIAGGLLTGVLLRFIRSIYDRASGNDSNILLYAFLFGIGFNEAASTPFFWMTNLPFTLFPLLLLFYLCRFRAPARFRNRPSPQAAPLHAVR